MQVLYLGRALRIKETLPDFLKWCRVTRHLLLFRGLTGIQRTPGFGASQSLSKSNSLISSLLSLFISYSFIKLILIFVFLFRSFGNFFSSGHSGFI